MKMFSRSFLSLGVALALTPAVFSVGPWVEANLFPVVKRTEILSPENTDIGASFFVTFHKARQCEFLSLVWYQDGDRLEVEFEPDARYFPRSRPTGGQRTGPWLVRGLTEIERSAAYLYHRCHPLWVTITPFFVGENYAPGAR